MGLGRFLAAYWRGALPLWQALAGPVACSTVLLWAVNRGLAGWPVLWLAVLDAPLVAWAVVGAFRTADRALRDGGGFVAGFAAYAGAGAVLLAAGTTLVARQTPVRTLTADMVPDARAAKALPEAAGRVRIEGDISFDGFNALKARLLRGGVTVVDLDSPGGNIFAARGLARLVEEAGLATHAQVRCYSACTLVFAAGSRRTMGQEGALGFHRYLLEAGPRYGAIRHVDTAEEEARDRAFLARRGIAAEFIARVHQTPPEALWRPTRAELKAAGMLTD